MQIGIIGGQKFAIQIKRYLPIVVLDFKSLWLL